MGEPNLTEMLWQELKRVLPANPIEVKLVKCNFIFTLYHVLIEVYNV